jgi:hypothetical protein
VFWIRLRDELMRVNDITNTTDGFSHTGLIFDWYEAKQEWSDAQVRELGDAQWSTEGLTPYSTETLVYQKPVLSDMHKPQFAVGMPSTGSFVGVIHGTAVLGGEAQQTRLLVKSKERLCRVWLNGTYLGISADAPKGRFFDYDSLAPGRYDLRIEFFPTTERASLHIEFERPIGNKLAQGQVFGPMASLRTYVHVTRGWDGTTPVDHDVQTMVTSPMYHGAAANQCGSGTLIPYGRGSSLSYWIAKTPGSKSLDYWGDLMIWDPELDDQGHCPYYHGQYFDASGSSLPSFNMGDAKGRAEPPWNITEGREMTEAEWQKGYETQYTLMARKFVEACNQYPLISANGGSYDDTPENDFFLRPGGATPMGIWQHSEAGFKKKDRKWSEQMPILQHIFDNDLGVSLQCKHYHEINDDFLGSNISHAQAKLLVEELEYCYANYLLVKVKGTHVPQLEWKPKYGFEGLYSWYQEGHFAPSTTTYRYGIFGTHPMFKYPLGDPIEHRNWQEYAVPNTGTTVLGNEQANGIHRRHFANGIVLVNPDAPISGLADINLLQLSDSNDQLNSTNSTIVNLDTPMIDASTGEVVDRVDVPGGKAKFLLHSPTYTTPVENAEKQWVPYYRSRRGVDDYGNPTPNKP